MSATQSADELLNSFVLHQYKRDRNAPNRHLVECPEAIASNASGEDSRCGEGTCEMLNVWADISCPHGESVHYEWDDFGSFAELYDHLDEWRAQQIATAREEQRKSDVAEQVKQAASADLPMLPDVGGWMRHGLRGIASELVVTGWKYDRETAELSVKLSDPSKSTGWNPDQSQLLVVDSGGGGKTGRSVFTAPQGAETPRYRGLPDGTWMCRLCGALVIKQHYHDRWHASGA